jgi:hypothetical protein
MMDGSVAKCVCQQGIIGGNYPAKNWFITELFSLAIPVKLKHNFTSLRYELFKVDFYKQISKQRNRSGPPLNHPRGR